MSVGDTPIVLVAEDDEDDRIILSSVCDDTHLGIRLEFVRNGSELLDYLYGCDNADDNVDRRLPSLILLDLNMPVMNGFETLEKIMTSNFRSIPVVIYTTSSVIEDQHRCIQLGAKGFITKSSSIENVVDKFRMVAALARPDVSVSKVA